MTETSSINKLDGGDQLLKNDLEATARGRVRSRTRPETTPSRGQHRLFSLKFKKILWRRKKVEIQILNPKTFSLLLYFETDNYVSCVFSLTWMVTQKCELRVAGKGLLAAGGKTRNILFLFPTICLRLCKLGVFTFH